jgi:fucose permease
LAGLLLPLALSASVAWWNGWRLVYVVPALVLGAWAVVAALGSQAPPSVVGERRSPFVSLRNGHVAMAWAVLVFSIVLEIGTGFWATEALQQLGGASTSRATALLPVYFAAMGVGRLGAARMVLAMGAPRLLASSPVVFAVGFVPFWLGPNLMVRVVGLAVMGVGLAPLYPLGVNRLLALGDGGSLGPVSALASAVGVVVGPLALGIASDAPGLKWALVVLPVTAALLIVVQRRERAVGPLTTPI